MLVEKLNPKSSELDIGQAMKSKGFSLKMRTCNKKGNASNSLSLY